MNDCTVCPTRPGQGWNETGVTHCRECHATWRIGTKLTHCITCHETFSTDSNCLRHQQPTKADPVWRCRPPAEVGLIPSDRPVNGHPLTVWQLPGSESRHPLSSVSGSDANGKTASQYPPNVLAPHRGRK